MNLRTISQEIRREILSMHARSGTSHVGSALSVVDILTILYFSVLNINPRKPFDKRRDRLVFSKGHAVSALYATLAIKGFFNKKILGHYCGNNTRLFGHSTYNCVPGVEISTGSLGHGLPIGVGIALANRMQGIRNKTYVIMSDGECEEGSVWESILFANHHCLDNLVVIIDYNKIQGLGPVKKILSLEPLRKKWQAFGWTAAETNGHDFMALKKLLGKIPLQRGRPSVIIAHTIKGKGVSFMENQLSWHYKSPDPAQLNAALKELKK